MAIIACSADRSATGMAVIRAGNCPCLLNASRRVRRRLSSSSSAINIASPLTTMSPPKSVHDQVKARSYLNLQKARDAACKGLYKPEVVQNRMKSFVKEKTNDKEPYPWQLDVGEAVRLKLDTVLIAPTDAGKGLPFIMPCLSGGKVLIISPLIAL